MAGAAPGFAERGAAIDPGGLSRSDALTRAVLLDRFRLEADSLAAAAGEVSVSGSIGGDLSVSPAWAGQGSDPSYALGQARIERIRDEARARLGSGFDLAEFHHLVLADGSMPLDALAASVSHSIGRKHPALVDRPSTGGPTF